MHEHLSNLYRSTHLHGNSWLFDQYCTGSTLMKPFSVWNLGPAGEEVDAGPVERLYPASRPHHGRDRQLHRAIKLRTESGHYRQPYPCTHGLRRGAHDGGATQRHKGGLPGRGRWQALYDDVEQKPFQKDYCSSCYCSGCRNWVGYGGSHEGRQEITLLSLVSGVSRCSVARGQQEFETLICDSVAAYYWYIITSHASAVMWLDRGLRWIGLSVAQWSFLYESRRKLWGGP